MTAATFSSRDVQIFARMLAEEIENSGANLLLNSFDRPLVESGDGNRAETFGSDTYLSQTLGTVLADSLGQYHVISDNTWQAGDPDNMSEDEMETAAAEKLSAIGKAGYLGMVQISRDGKAAIDSDAPKVIRLSITPETVSEEEQYTLLKDAAVLLKNDDDTLPLKTSDEAEVIVVKDAEGSELSDEDAENLKDGLSKARQEGKKTVLVIENSQPVDISGWIDSCDAVLMLWQDSPDAGQAEEDILSGKLNPSGKLPSAWINGPEEWDIGYGLSYTDFSASLENMQTASVDDEDYGYDLTVRVTNEGSIAGNDTILLYIGDEKGENTALCAYAKTDVLESGSSTEVTLHITQAALADSEGKVTGGEKRTVFVGIPAGKQSIREELEIKAARAGAEISVVAPENVKVGEEFELKISTPPDVISLQLTDSDGNAYQPTDLLKENLGESITGEILLFRPIDFHILSLSICLFLVLMEKNCALSIKAIRIE